MNPGLVVKLRPSGPWRIGPDSGARNRVDVIYHSDSLYSAITAAMSRLGWLEEWLDGTARTATPAVSFSSCFPFLRDMAFVVPPRTVWPPASSSTKAARIRWKSARFVPLTVVQSILSGQRLDDNQWGVDGPSDCLVPAGKPGPFRTAVRSNAGVDRLSGASERHSTACLEFRADSGLWTVVSFADEAAHGHWSVKVKAAFRLLADTGFGGERSRGWGRSEAPEFIDGMLPDLILPTPTESAAAEIEPEIAEAAVVAASPIAPLVVEREAPTPAPAELPTRDDLQSSDREGAGTSTSNSPAPESPVAESDTPAVETAPTEALAAGAEAPTVNSPEPESPAAESEAPAVETAPTEAIAVGAEAPTVNSPEPESPAVESGTPAVQTAPTEALAAEAETPAVNSPEPESPVAESEAPAVETAPPEGLAAGTEAPAVNSPELELPAAESEAPAVEAAPPEGLAAGTEAPAVETETSATPVAESEAPVAEPPATVPEPPLTEPPATESPETEPEPPAVEPEPPEPESPVIEPEASTAAGSPEPEPEPQPVHAGAPTHPHWLLSLFTPAPADSVDWHRGNYIVLPRGGRIDSPVASGDLKKQIPMVAEGSVLYAETTPRGSAADVAPDGFAHPVFRAGFAVAIPLPEVR